MPSDDAATAFPSVGKQKSQSPRNGIGFQLGFAKPGSKWKNVTQRVGRRNPTVVGAVGKIQELTQQEKEAERLETLMQELGPALSAFELFAEVNPRLQRRIVDRVHRVRFGPGENVCSINEEVELVVLIVLEGRLAVSTCNGTVVDTIGEQE